MSGQAAKGQFTRVELIALVVAGLGGVGLLVAALFAPFYTSSVSTLSGTGVATHNSGSATLVEENGLWVLAVVAVPLLVSIAVAITMALRNPARGTGALAWTLVALLGGVTVAGLMTIGVFILPTTAALVTVAAVRHGRRDRELPTRPPAPPWSRQPA
jgi:hypothetical protein